MTVQQLEHVLQHSWETKPGVGERGDDGNDSKIPKEESIIEMTSVIVLGFFVPTEVCAVHDLSFLAHDYRPTACHPRSCALSSSQNLFQAHPGH